MIIEIPDVFFECPEDERPDKVLFISQLLDNGHYIQPRIGLTEKLVDLFDSFGTKMECELLANSFELLSPSDRIKEYLTIINLSDYDELQRKVLLFKPSELLVEFAPYEWNAYRRIVKAYRNDPTYSSIFSLIKKKIDNFFLVPANAGGYASIPALITLKDEGEYYHLYKRKVCVVFDRDKDNRNDIDANKNRLFEELAHKQWNQVSNSDIYKLDFGTGYIWHMWYKRAIENYFPPEQFEALGAHMDKARGEDVDYDYYIFDVNDADVKYKKSMMQRVGNGLSRTDYESRLQRFAFDNTEYSEFQLLLLKIAKIV